ncbi:MAG TPA: tetratricopeptide repeat protein [Chroococcales cyanobacterium]
MKTDHMPDLEKLLKIQIHLHGGDSPQVAKVLQRIADLHFTNRDFQTCETMYRRALAIEESADEPDLAIIETLKSKLETATLKKNEEGDESYRLKVSSSSVPTFTPEMDSLLETAGAPDSEVLDACRHITQLRKSSPQSTALADALTRVADLYCRRKMHHDMEAPLLEALKIREAAYGSTHLSVATDLKNLARLYMVLGQLDLGESHLQRALTIRENALGKNHPHVADLADLYGRLLKMQGRLEESAEMEKIVTDSRERYGTDWQHYKAAGEKAQAEGNYFLAHAMWLAALEEAKEFKFDDPRLSTVWENLAQVYWKREKFEKAVPLCRQILQVSESVLGRDHPDVAVAANNLALLYERLEKFTEAAILYQQAAAIKEKMYGATHADVIALIDAHARARQMAQRQIEQKVDRASGRFKAIQ